MGLTHGLFCVPGLDADMRDAIRTVKTGRCLDELVRMIRRVGGEDAGVDQCAR